MDLHEAKRLFFAYDGFHFHMMRDGDEPAYREANVPPEVEAAWLRELTEIKLERLSERGNWQVVDFLDNHRDHRHLDARFRAEPLGVFWEKCAFLEHLTRYALGAWRSGADRDLAAAVLHKIVNDAGRLFRTVRAERSVARVREIVADAERALETLAA